MHKWRDLTFMYALTWRVVCYGTYIFKTLLYEMFLKVWVWDLGCPKKHFLVLRGYWCINTFSLFKFKFRTYLSYWIHAFSFFAFRYNVIMFNWKQGSKLPAFHHFNQIVRVTYSQLRTNLIFHSTSIISFAFSLPKASFTWASKELAWL